MSDDTTDQDLLPDVTRRNLLKGSAAASAGLSVASGRVGAMADGTFTDPETIGSEFEEREWGYVRSDYDPPAGKDRPVIMTMDGYGMAEPPTHYLRMRDGALISVKVSEEFDGRWGDMHYFRDEYVRAHVSIRGTGCSDGRFDLWDRVHARDGFEIVEWLADRPWALDRVGFHGNSWPGIEALLLASTQPPSLAAISAGEVVADFYRDVGYPGGVPNLGFGAIWSNGLRHNYEFDGTLKGLEDPDDSICAQNISDRDESAYTYFTGDTDATAWYARRRPDNWWYSRAPITYADQISVPTLIAHAWHDDQVNARGGFEMFRSISPDPASPPGWKDDDGTPPTGSGVGRGPPGGDNDSDHRHEEPKLLVMSNGGHGNGRLAAGVSGVLQQFFDYWLLGEDNGVMDEPRVKLWFTVGNAGFDGDHREPKDLIELDDYPPKSVQWRRYYLHPDNRLAPSVPDSAGTDTYLTGTDERLLVDYISPRFDEPKLIAGPLAARVYLESTAPDTDLYVRLWDITPEGNASFFQRGLLRASHQSLFEGKSLHTADGELYRPYHAHTNTDAVDVGSVRAYDIEIWSVGHVVYPGHRLAVMISDPPTNDDMSAGYIYDKLDGKGMNTIHRGPDHQSSVLVPLVDSDDVAIPPNRGCGSYTKYNCVDYGAWKDDPAREA